MIVFKKVIEPEIVSILYNLFVATIPYKLPSGVNAMSEVPNVGVTKGIMDFESVLSFTIPIPLQSTNIHWACDILGKRNAKVK